MELKFILEAVLFQAQKPQSIPELRGILVKTAEAEEADEVARTLRAVRPEAIEAALQELAQEHESAARSYRLACVAGAWQFVSLPDFAPWLRVLVGIKNRPTRLSQPALETLAIIAYRQPITRAEVEQIRGVAVDGVLATLLERGLIEHAGRAEVVGRPMTYATTNAFLEYFGLGRLEDLPAADELRRIPVQRPDSLLTVDSGLATVPPEQLALPNPPEASTTAAAAADLSSPQTNSPPDSSTAVAPLENATPITNPPDAP